VKPATRPGTRELTLKVMRDVMYCGSIWARMSAGKMVAKKTALPRSGRDIL
jgi:hypothetical protein